MGLEMMAFRILPPNFGSSLYVWGSIISVFLTALTLGYYFGGVIADRRPRLAALGLVGRFVWPLNQLDAVRTRLCHRRDRRGQTSHGRFDPRLRLLDQIQDELIATSRFPCRAGTIREKIASEPT